MKVKGNMFLQDTAWGKHVAVLLCSEHTIEEYNGTGVGLERKKVTWSAIYGITWSMEMEISQELSKSGLVGPADHLIWITLITRPMIYAICYCSISITLTDWKCLMVNTTTTQWLTVRCTSSAPSFVPQRIRFSRQSNGIIPTSPTIMSLTDNVEQHMRSSTYLVIHAMTERKQHRGDKR